MVQLLDRVSYSVVPKYRRKILVNDVAEETKRIVAECCSDAGIDRK